MPAEAPRRRSLRLPWTAQAALIYLPLLLLYYFPDPRQIVDLYLGDASYGAYQETLWWYDHFAHHLLDASAYLHSPMQKVPVGIRVHVLYGADYATALLFAPFRHLLPLNLATNLFILFVLLLAAVAACQLAQGLGSGRPLSLAIGFFFAANPYLETQLETGRLTQVFVFTFPWFMHATIRFWRHGGRGPFAASVLLLILTFYLYLFYGFFMLGLALVMPLFSRPTLRAYLRAVGPLVGLTLLGILPLFILLIPQYSSFTNYTTICPSYGICGPDLPAAFCPIYNHSLALQQFSATLGHPLVAAGLAGLLVRSPYRTFGVIALAATVLALGPYLILDNQIPETCLSQMPLPFYFLHGYLPGARSFNHPERFLIISLTMGATVLAYLGSRARERWHTPAWRRIQAVIALLVVAIFVIRGTVVSRSGPPPDMAMLRTLGDGRSPLIFLPLQFSDFVTYSQIFHRRPMLNGDGMLLPFKNSAPFNQLLERNTFIHFLRDLYVKPDKPPSFDPRHFDELKQYGFSHIILCKHLYRNRHLRGFLMPLQPDPSPEALRHHARAVAKLHRKVAARMEALLGPPMFDEPDLTIYRIPSRPR